MHTAPRRRRRLILSQMLFAGALMASPALAQTNAVTVQDAVADPATLQSLGVRWPFTGDDNRNAKATMTYRSAGSGDWKPALPLVRSIDISKADGPGPGVFAGSVFNLEPNTKYEVRVTIEDPDGGKFNQTLEVTTWAGPKEPTGRDINVIPGELADALTKATPGDILRLQSGEYRGSFTLPSGEEGKPIAIVGPEDGTAIIIGEAAPAEDGQAAPADVSVFYAAGASDLILMNLTIRKGSWGIAANASKRITVRNCTFEDVDHAFTASRQSVNILIENNVMTGRSGWAKGTGSGGDGRNAINIAGQGHVIRNNRISEFAAGIVVSRGADSDSIDIYHNDIFDTTGTAIDLIGSRSNVRCFENRITNASYGIGLEALRGGPLYVIRNSMYNVTGEPFRVRAGSTGPVILHNSVVRAGSPMVVMARGPVVHGYSRNNLFVGSEGSYAHEGGNTMQYCDYDYDGYAGKWSMFLKWNNERYATIADVKSSSPVYVNVIEVNPEGLFSKATAVPTNPDERFDRRVNDLSLTEKNDAIDAGTPLPNISDTFNGRAPDLGAHESGTQRPRYGPRR